MAETGFFDAGYARLFDAVQATQRGEIRWFRRPEYRDGSYADPKMHVFVARIEAEHHAGSRWLFTYVALCGFTHQRNEAIWGPLSITKTRPSVSARCTRCTGKLGADTKNKNRAS